MKSAHAGISQLDFWGEWKNVNEYNSYTHVYKEGRMNSSRGTVKIDLFVERVESEFYYIFITTHLSTFKMFIRHIFCANHHVTMLLLILSFY